MQDQYSSKLINYVTRIHFGYGAALQLRAELERMGVQRPLVVTDEGLMRTGMIEQVMQGLSYTVFSGTPSNPTEAAARAAAAVFKEKKCDSIVALGGGSPLDMAKVVGLMQNHSGPLIHYALKNGGLNLIRDCIPPTVAIPTTAGTGSEVARAAVLILDDGSKLTIASPYLVPSVALCDPTLTFSMPSKLAAATGFDAIAHCIETYSSPTINPPAAAIALDGLQRLMLNIELAMQQDGHRAAKWHMLMGSLQGALAFQKGLGAVHALSHPLGAFGYHHGTLNGLLLPYVLRFNREALGSKLSEMERVVGLTGSIGLDDHIHSLLTRLQLPQRLGDLGFSRNSITSVALSATQDPCTTTNPRQASERDYEELLMQAL